MIISCASEIAGGAGKLVLHSNSLITLYLQLDSLPLITPGQDRTHKFKIYIVFLYVLKASGSNVATKQSCFLTRCYGPAAKLSRLFDVAPYSFSGRHCP